MPISWTEALTSADQSLAGELARRKLADDQVFRAIQEQENVRATRAHEGLQNRQLDEQSRLREAQQEETMRRNREAEEARQNAQDMTALGLLEPGTQVDPELVMRLTKRGLGGMFEANPEKGLHSFKGTAAQLRAIEREKMADQRATLAEQREARMTEHQNAILKLQEAQLRDAQARTAIQQAREQRLGQVQQNIGKLTPAQQIAYRTVFKQLQTEAQEKRGGVMSTVHNLTGGLLGAPEDELDVIGLAEEAYKRVTGSSVLAPHVPAPAAGGPGPQAPAAPTTPNPAATQPRVIAPGISVTRRQ